MIKDASAMATTCTFCTRIKEIKAGNAPSDLIAELPTGYLLLNWFQFYRGYCLFVSKEHATELDELPHDFAMAFQNDMLRCHRAVRVAVEPRKMNVASIGNEIKHVHWHIIPRHTNDPMPDVPIWELRRSVRQSKAFRITETSHLDLIEQIRLQLR